LGGPEVIAAAMVEDLRAVLEALEMIVSNSAPDKELAPTYAAPT
jgi:hypothetical protein